MYKYIHAHVEYSIFFTCRYRCTRMVAIRFANLSGLIRSLTLNAQITLNEYDITISYMILRWCPLSSVYPVI